MLTALLALDAVLKKSLKNIQRRGIDKLITNRGRKCMNTESPSGVSKKSALVNLRPLPTIMSTGQQSPPPPVTTAALTENMDSALNNSSAIISFKPGDKHCCHEISTTNVKIIANPGIHDHGSSKVKLKNIVDYKWEVKNYPGHLIAVHIDEKYIAYVINGMRGVEGNKKDVDGRKGGFWKPY